MSNLGLSKAKAFESTRLPVYGFFVREGESAFEGALHKGECDVYTYETVSVFECIISKLAQVANKVVAKRRLQELAPAIFDLVSVSKQRWPAPFHLECTGWIHGWQATQIMHPFPEHTTIKVFQSLPALP